MVARPRQSGTDYLRALATFLVLGIHFFGFRAFVLGLHPDDIPWMFRAFGHGYFGVNIFFVISGFLITSTSTEIDSDGSLKVAAYPFYIRRVTRILPLLLATIAVSALCLHFFSNTGLMHRVVFTADGADFSPGFWLSIATFSFNWFRIAFSGPDGWGMQWDILWSLAVEEQFYLVFPLMMTVLSTVRRVRIAMLVVMVVATLVRAVMLWQGEGWLPVLTNSITCFDGLAIGVLTATLPSFRRRTTRLWAAWGGAAALVVAYLCKASVAFGLPVLTLAIGTALIIQAGRMGGGRWRSLRIVADFGKMSYGIYLLHPLCLFVIGPWTLHTNPALGFLALVVASYLCAKLSYAWFERPTELAFRRKWLSTPAVQPSGLPPLAAVDARR